MALLFAGGGAFTAFTGALAVDAFVCLEPPASEGRTFSTILSFNLSSAPFTGFGAGAGFSTALALRGPLPACLASVRSASPSSSDSLLERFEPLGLAFTGGFGASGTMAVPFTFLRAPAAGSVGRSIASSSSSSDPAGSSSSSSSSSSASSASSASSSSSSPSSSSSSGPSPSSVSSPASARPMAPSRRRSSVSSMLASSSVNSNGLSTWASAPYKGEVISFRFSPIPVSMTTPVCANETASRILRHTSHPLIPGIITSRTTRSGRFS